MAGDESWAGREVRPECRQELQRLRSSLANGGVVAFPTESSYGLGADPRSQKGVATVFEIKKRPADKPLPVVVADLAQAADLGVDLDDPGLALVADLWPAALTLVVPVAEPLPATAGGDRLAIRVPDHDDLRRLLSGLGHGLTATSANRSDAPPICRTSELEALLAGFDVWWLDGGDLPGGPPSTMVGWEQASGSLRLLRAGRFVLPPRLFSPSSAEPHPSAQSSEPSGRRPSTAECGKHCG